MSRIRTIKPEIVTDEKTGGLSDGAFRLFVACITLADDYGRLKAHPGVLCGHVFWNTPRVDVAELLAEMETAGLVRRYVVRGQHYAELNGWGRHQRVDHPGKPLCPEPPASHEPGSNGAPPTANGAPPAPAVPEPAPWDQGPAAAPADPANDIAATVNPLFREGVASCREASRAPREPLASPPETLVPDRDRDRDQDQDQGGDPDPDAIPPPPRPGPGPRPTRCTGYDLLRWYALERQKVVPTALPFTTPRSSEGKASSFAEQIEPAAVADIRPSMALHFAELLAGTGPPNALQSPTYGFACWTSDFSRLREQLHGAAPASTTSRRPERFTAGATDAAKARILATSRRYAGRPS